MIIDNYLKKYKPLYRGHTPGHKGRLCGMDITEILDEFPSDCILEAERKTAEVYGVKAIRYLVNGSSIGIKAAVMALKEDFITDRYYHTAVTEAATLAGVKVHVLNNAYNESEDMYELTTAEMIEKAIKESGIKNVLLQYPDYYGRTSDIAEISKVVKAHGGKLICDSAHGAHFAFRRDLFPALGTDYSDICNMSAHKTLYAFTQTAYLAINNADLIGSVDSSLKYLGTTSPNYLLLSSLELATEKGIETAGRYDELKAFVESYKKEFPDWIRSIYRGCFIIGARN